MRYNFLKDSMVVQVADGLDGLKRKAEMMGEAIDKQEDAIDGLKVEIDKAHEGLVTSNARLKKVLYQVLNSQYCF